MAKKIVILEDNADRVAAMRRCMEDRFYQFEVVFFDAIPPLQNYFEQHLHDIIAISLDHDLELQPGPKGGWIDPGTGREIASYLAGKKPVCPVVIHTSNYAAADGMDMVLQDAGWLTYRVVPAGDLDWIPSTWFRTIRRAIVGKTAASRTGAN